MPSAVRLYVLHLASRAQLRRAFGRLLDAARVASCTVELEARRLRFLAPEDCAEGLVEEIYREGGLTWCSRHGIGAPPAALSAPPPTRQHAPIESPPSV